MGQGNADFGDFAPDFNAGTANWAQHAAVHTITDHSLLPLCQKPQKGTMNCYLQFMV